VEQPRNVPLDLFLALRDDVADLRTAVAELRTNVTHLTAEMVEVKQDIRRLDGRVFQLMLAQLATLGTALASLVATIS
jgi:hypothetical protein